jgi:hypothetical protein
MKRDHIIGHNARPTTDDDNLLPILDEFWDGNGLENRASQFTMQLFGFGEQCFPVFVRESDGRVRIGYVDPESIVKVIKHPDNALEDWAVVTERYVSGAYTAEKIVYRIVREDESYIDEELIESANAGKLVTHMQAVIQPWELKMLAEYGRSEYDGSCFYEKVNAVSNQSRGMSDLLQVADWINQADEVLFSLADREQMAGFFAFDVTLTNAGDELIRKRSRELRMNPPSKGSVNVHNDAETWQMWSPDLNQGGSIETFRAILGLILGGMGFPVHWFGYGDDANRATAVAQATPTTKSLEHDQGIIQDMLLHMCQFAADQAEIAGSYTPDEDMEITLDMPEVTTKDLTMITASMQALVVSLVNAQDSGWISQETAAQAFARIMSELDIQYDVAEELEMIEEEQEEAELVNATRVNGQLQMMMAQGMANANGDENNEGTAGSIRPQAE